MLILLSPCQHHIWYRTENENERIISAFVIRCLQLLRFYHTCCLGTGCNHKKVRLYLYRTILTVFSRRSWSLRRGWALVITEKGGQRKRQDKNSTTVYHHVRAACNNQDRWWPPTVWLGPQSLTCRLITTVQTYLYK